MQTNYNKNYDSILKKCNEISKKMFELYDILEKEENNMDNNFQKFIKENCKKCKEPCEKGITVNSDFLYCADIDKRLEINKEEKEK